jgi:hypothetical protein
MSTGKTKRKQKEITNYMFKYLHKQNIVILYK